MINRIYDILYMMAEGITDIYLFLQYDNSITFAFEYKFTTRTLIH